MQDVDAELTDVDEKEDEEAEGTVAPETEKAEKKKSGGESENRGSESRRSWADAGHLKAPYSGLYQQTNEQGVKSRNQSRARPKSTP